MGFFSRSNPAIGGLKDAFKKDTLKTVALIAVGAVGSNYIGGLLVSKIDFLKKDETVNKLALTGIKLAIAGGVGATANQIKPGIGRDITIGMALETITGAVASFLPNTKGVPQITVGQGEYYNGQGEYYNGQGEYVDPATASLRAAGIAA